MKTPLFVLLLATLPALAEDLTVYPKEPDHTLLVSIETVPPHATVSALAAGTNSETNVLGETPYVAVVECQWQTRFLIKQWARMQLWSPGGMARSEFDAHDKSYAIYARFMVSAKGYASQTVDTYVTTFPYMEDWDNIDALPQRETVTVQLNAKPAERGEMPAPAPVLKTVMVATGDATAGEDYGTLELTADVNGAQVSADGQDVVPLPVRLLLREGEHTIVVSAPDLPNFQRTLSVTPGQTRTLRVRLAPEAGN